MKNDYIVRAKKFLDVFSKYLPNKQWISYREAREAIFNYWRDNPRRKIKLCSGASRLVFVTSDYAIKVDTARESFWGNSEDEIKVYNFALQHGFSHLFLPIKKYTINEHAFYIFPRTKSTMNERNLPSYYDEDDDYYFYNFFTDEDDREFIEEYIYDLHAGNISTFHGKPVIIDYASHKTLQW